MPSFILKNLICFLFLVCFNSGIAQTNTVDSLLALVESTESDIELSKLYDQILDEYYFKDQDLFDKYVDLRLFHAEKSGSREQIVSAKYNLAISKYQGGLLDEAMEILNEILDEAKTIHKPLDFVKMLNMKSTIHGIVGQYAKALEIQIECLRLIKENDGTDIQKAISLMNIGNVHGSLEQYDKSSEYYAEAKELFRASDDLRMSTRMNSLMALNKQAEGDFSTARVMMEESLEAFRELGRPADIVKILSYLGGVKQQMKDYEGALSDYKEAVSLTHPEEIDLIADINQRLAHINIDLKNYKETIDHIKKANPLNQIMGDAEALRRDHEFSMKAYAGMKNYKEAYFAFERYATINDSLTSSLQASIVNELEVKYQTEKKEQEIKLLEEKAKHNSLVKKGMIGGIIGLIGLICALVFGMRQRLIKNKLAKQKVDQELEFSQKELEFNQKELDLKKQELTAYALQLAHKNEVLQDIKNNVSEAKSESDNNRALQKVINKIDFNQNDDETWVGFRTRFQAIHKDFESKVKSSFPAVTPNELRLMSLLKLNLSSKEIANILNISGEGIKKARYRLRKKLGLETVASLEELVLSI